MSGVSRQCRCVLGSSSEQTATIPTHIADAAMGIVFIYETSGPAFYPAAALNMGVSFFSISFSLNVILTLMIATRLMLHSRNIQNAIGAPTKTSGLYKAIVTMLVESSAIYAVAFIPYIVPRSIESSVSYVFFPTLLCAQVRVFPPRCDLELTVE